MTMTALKRLFCFAVSIGCLFTSCHREKITPLSPDEFTKARQEALGDILQESIALEQGTFQILPKQTPYDTSIYWFIQKLYDQATNLMRIDHQSPTDNRWDKDRPWEVTILVDNEKNAFVLPGGAFYITTGLLQTLREEYELYYILSFEANLMHEGLLLERLVSEVNSSRLMDIVLRDFDPKQNEVTTVTRILDQLEFDPENVQDNDLLTVNSICKTSQWDRTGLAPLLETFDNNIEWLRFRPSYGNRKNWLLENEPTAIDECGILKTNNPSGEGYKRYVLDRLN